MSVGPVARSEGTEAFFDGTAREEFLLKRCPEGHWSRPQAHVCASCGREDLDDAPSSGRARLVSWAVVHPRHGGEPDLPAIVELEEGPWWWTRIVGVDPASLAGGMALQVRFERPEGSEAVPVFSPAG